MGERLTRVSVNVERRHRKRQRPARAVRATSDARAEKSNKRALSTLNGTLNSARLSRPRFGLRFADHRINYVDRRDIGPRDRAFLLFFIFLFFISKGWSGGKAVASSSGDSPSGILRLGWSGTARGRLIGFLNLGRSFLGGELRKFNFRIFLSFFKFIFIGYSYNVVIYFYILVSKVFITFATRWKWYLVF